MPTSVKSTTVSFVLGVIWLISLLSLSIQVHAAPIWRTTNMIAQSKHLGCTQSGCNFDQVHSNSTSEFLLTTTDGEPIQLPELSAGHFLVIPVAAVAAVGYHLFKIRTGKAM